MRLPVHSERDVFRIVMGTVAVAVVAIVVGALTDPLAGLGVFVAAVIVAVVLDLRAKDPDRLRPLREAEDAGRARPPTGGPRLLVVANQTLRGGELRGGLLPPGPRPEVRGGGPGVRSRGQDVHVGHRTR